MAMSFEQRHGWRPAAAAKLLGYSQYGERP